MAYLSREARHEQIITAAIDLVTYEGLCATTVRRIAQELECSPGQIHHHFASADALRAEAIRDVWNRLETQLTDALKNYSPRERILIVMAGCNSTLPADLVPIMLIAQRLWKEAWNIPREPAVREAITEGIGKMYDKISSSLREGIQSGQFPTNLEVGKTALSLIASSQGFDLLEEIGAAGELGQNKAAFLEDVLRKEGL